MRICTCCIIRDKRASSIMLESLFQPLADVLGLPVDQARYVILMFINVPVAMAFRHLLHPSHTSLLVRHSVSTLLGLLLCIICFDWDVFILLGDIAVSYVILLVSAPSVVQRYTMLWVMGTMCSAHLYRTLTDFGGYHLDFSGSMMIITQKLSLVAFALHDGRGGNPRPLNKDQEENKLKSIPSILEYLSYTLNFHSILIGAAYTMKQHLDFMEGSNLKPLDNPNQFARAKEHSKAPSPLYPVVSKLIQAIVILATYVFMSDYVIELILDPSYSFFYRLYLMLAVGMRLKLGFYFMWVLADCINNAAGLGFSGYDAMGNAKWDITSNINILDMELSMNLKTTANSWNITTSLWLRRVCYERVTWQPGHMSFLLSALWHGFYPGYYTCLLYLAFALNAAKRMWRLLNPYFTSHGLALKWSYHIVTWLFTQVYAFYGALALYLMWLPEILVFWRSLYFFPVWTSLLVVFFFPSGRPSKKIKTEEVATGDGKSPPELKSDKQD